MDRLTSRGEYEQVVWVNAKHMSGSDEWIEPPEEMHPAIEKLAHYEDLEEQGRLVNEEDILKFYYIDSEDKYVVGQRLDTMYYAEVTENFILSFYMSRFLPWSEHVVNENTAWKEHTYCSKPRKIPFTEWLEGFIKQREAKLKLDAAAGSVTGRRRLMWCKLIQAICWLLNGRDEMECLFTVLGKRKVCENCKHNEWRDAR